MAFDDREILNEALAEWAQEFYEQLLEDAKSNPDEFRRGVAAYFQTQPTSSQKTELRRQIQETGQSDPLALSKQLEGMVKDTSFQEVLDLMGGGRLPKLEAQ